MKAKRDDGETEEIVCGKCIVVPDLNDEDRRLPRLRLVQTPEVFPAFDDDALLRRNVLERKHESPVEVAFAVQRSDTSQHSNHCKS